tara:strand:- start:1111 stop:3042 length:1932 start_codon:yes stop_codon:yes gene_type:complete
MSGQPNINPLDPMKFRNAYMANLNLRADLDDFNLQANKVYKRTGQLPQEMTDNRTSAEKLADILKLRLEVRTKLNEITDGQQANAISNELTPREVIFYAQHSPIINSIIKPRYAQGVLSYIFIPFLQRYMSESAGNAGIGSGLQQTSGANIILNSTEILRGLINREDIRSIDELTQSMNRSPIWRQLKITMGRLGENIPQEDTLQRINSIADPLIKNGLLHALNESLREFPSTFEAKALVLEYTRFKGANDRGMMERILGQMVQSFTISPAAISQLQRIRAELDRSARDAPTTSFAPDREELTENNTAEEVAGTSTYTNEMTSDIDTTAAQAPQAPQAPPLRPPARPPAAPPSGTKTKKPTEENVPLEPNAIVTLEMFGIGKGTKTKEVIQAWLRGKIDAQPDLFVGTGKSPKWIVQTRTKADMREYLSQGNLLARVNAVKVGGGGGDVAESTMGGTELEAPSPPDSGSESGSGFGRRMRGRGLSSGVKATERFVPFGRYVINQHRLNSDIVAVKRPAGSCIKDFPSCRVGKNLGKVIRKIAGGGLPKFEEFEVLDDGERAYLHKLAKSSNILDRLSIPAPDKDEGQKMIDDFELMKGEIMAGNDNKDMIKKFKILLMKLSNTQQLPKSQVRDILFDLTSMGF